MTNKPNLDGAGHRIWSVVKFDGSYYIPELAKGDSPLWDLMSPRGQALGQVLMYFYPSGECDAPYDEEKMESACYDLANTCDELKDGDVLDTPHGSFEVVGPAVRRRFETPGTAKARRARLRRMARRFA